MEVFIKTEKYLYYVTFKGEKTCYYNFIRKVRFKGLKLKYIYEATWKCRRFYSY